MSTAFRRALAIGALVAAPVLFASNVVIGRAAATAVEPWTLACLRWTLAVAILAPLAWRDARRVPQRIAAEPVIYLSLAFTGMFVCGGLFYLALRMTSATHAALIYTTSPLMVIVLERIFRGRPIAPREILGIVVASVGVGVIVSRGGSTTGDAGDVVVGDLLVLACAFSWAVYSVLLRRREVSAEPVTRVFLAGGFLGSLMLMPPMVVEIIRDDSWPATAEAWAAIAGAAILVSILAFLTYQYAVQVVGPAMTSLTLYVMPVAAVGLAVIILGERPGASALVGSALVFGGIVVATARFGRRDRNP